jgi:rhodanese-related sulfurtransferase
MGGNFATYSGWVLPPDKTILLVVDRESDALEAAVWLRRVGLDNVAGYLNEGMFAWSTDGLTSDHVCQISARELHERITKGTPLTLLDVRAPSEFESFHIEGAVNIPFHDVREQYKKLDPNMPTAVMCGSGHRSSLAASLLKQRGFKEVYNVAGGMTGYTAAGLGPECPHCVAPHGPKFMGS